MRKRRDQIVYYQNCIDRYESRICGCNRPAGQTEAINDEILLPMDYFAFRNTFMRDFAGNSIPGLRSFRVRDTSKLHLPCSNFFPSGNRPLAQHHRQ